MNACPTRELKFRRTRRIRVWAKCAAVLVFVYTCATTVAEGRSILVRPDGSGDYPNIANAVEAAQSGDEIVLADGTFTGTQNRRVLIELKSVSVRSESGDPAKCTIDCGFGGLRGGIETNHAFLFSLTGDVPPVLEGITFTGGSATLGGAVALHYATLLIRNCVFRDNYAWEGGALLVQSSSPIIENCLFLENEAGVYPGGAVFCIANAMPTIRGCTFVRNTATGPVNGGVIGAAKSSNVIIENSIIVNSIQGGAVFCDDSSTISATCTDIWENGGGDWIECLASQNGTNGNISLDPLFCDPALGNYTLREDSPCASPGSNGCGLVGALPVGCLITSITESTWGQIKARYRWSD